MKKTWTYLALFFTGFATAMTVAFFGKKTTVVNINKEENVDINKPKIKNSDGSIIDNIVSQSKKLKTESKDKDGKRKINILKNRRKKNGNK